MRRHLLNLTVLLLAACGGEAREAERAVATQTAIAKAESTATQAAALPATGLWTEAHLMDRLVRTGVLPRALEVPLPETPWMGKPPIALTAGGGEVFVWIYDDSIARKAVTDALDADFAAPRGQTSPFPIPLVFVVNNNLAAVITGGSGQNQERIMLALQAGLPVQR